MRVNVYSQELTEEIELVKKEGINKDGATEEFIAVRLFLESSDKLHAEPGDDDRSAVTFWLPRSIERRLLFAQTLEDLAALIQSSL